MIMLQVTQPTGHAADQTTEHTHALSQIMGLSGGAELINFDITKNLSVPKIISVH